MPGTNNGYIGQYGESLRRLSALNLGMPPAPQNMGGADMGGALPPPAMPGAYDRAAQDASTSIGQSGVPAGALPASDAGPPPTGALNTPPAPQGPAGGKPIGIQDMMGAATTDQKEAALKNLEKHVNIDDEFGALQENGIIPKDEKMSRHEKGMLVMEFGLRMMSAASQGADAAGAAGIAGQGLLESYRARKDKEQSEVERQTERAQDREDKRQERASTSQDRTNENNSRQTISYQEQAAASNRNNADIQSREKIANLEAKTRLQEARTRAATEKQPMHFVDANGDLKLVDAAGNVTTPTEETTDAKTGKKGRKTVKPLQKEGASGLDQDKIQGLIEQEKKRLSEDSATTRDMRKRGLTAPQMDAELEKQARKNIMGRLPAGSNSADPLNLGLE